VAREAALAARGGLRDVAAEVVARTTDPWTLAEAVVGTL